MVPPSEGSLFCYLTAASFDVFELYWERACANSLKIRDDRIRRDIMMLAPEARITLWEDADGRHKAVLMRYDKGAVIPRHRHVGDEQIWVLEGAVADDAGVCTAGNYARRPPGCVHTVTSPSGALVLAVISGPTEPV